MAGVLLRGLITRIVLAAVAVSLGYLLASAALDPRAGLEGSAPHAPRAAVEERLDELGVNGRVPLPERYLRWGSGLVRGDFGATMDGTPAGAEMRRRIGVSTRLMAAGAVIGSALGVAVGAAGAIGPGGVLDRIAMIGTFAVLAVPAAALAVVVQIGAQWANDRSGVRLFAWTGEATPGRTGGLPWQLGGHLQHLAPPTVTVALGRAAALARYARAAMIDASAAAFVRTAMAKGMTRRGAQVRHALRVALVPVVPLSAFGCTGLLAGAACTEKVFAWHGMGEWLIDSIHRQDVNAVAAYCCFAALLVLVAGLTSDLLVAVLDPRARG